MQAFALLPLAGIALLAGVILLRRRHVTDTPQGARHTFGWAPAYFAYLAFPAIWCLSGLYVGSGEVLLLFVTVCVACGVATMGRWDFARLLADLGAPRELVRALRDAVVLLLSTWLTMIGLELVWNDGILAMDPTGVGLELSMIGLLLLVLYFAAQRSGVAAAAGSAALYVAGMANGFVLAFKSEVIMPSDLLALGTAAAVSSGLHLELGDNAFLALSAQAVATCWLSFLVPLPAPDGQDAAPSDSPRAPRRSTVVRVGVNVALAVACALGLRWVALGQSYQERYGVVLISYKDSYQRYGFLTGFMAVLQNMAIKVPEGYSNDAAQLEEEALAQEHIEALNNSGRAADVAAAQAQFEGVRPTVICVMDETFSDLSRLGGLGCGYTGPAYFNSIDDALFRGTLDVSVRGGGTSNTEFEFLTGTSMAYIGPGKYPYPMYHLAGTSSLASQLGELGYSTTAIHPNLATNWKRDEVYEALGFDRFLSIDDFDESDPWLHMGVTDAATYDKILELLEEDEGPQFIFDVTMQNHTPYNLGNIPEDMLTHYEPTGFSDDDVAQLNEYLTCIQASDQDLEEFMGRLRELDRPVVLVFFGDHQPGISPTFNDALFQGEDELTHTLRTFQTDYVVWANYDVAGSDQASEVLETSPAYLGSQVFEAIGAPLTTYQQASLGARLSMPAVSLIGYRAADGTWHQPCDGSDAEATYDRLALVTYLEFGSRVA